MKANRYGGSFLIVQGALAVICFLIATPAIAQDASTENNPLPVQVQSPVKTNPLLQQVRESPAATLKFQTTESRIGPDDLLNIVVFEAPEMNCTVRVTTSGEISLQLLGPVRAAGLTARELESILQSLLRRTYMKDPHVGVFLQELQSHPVSVVGAVKMPGVFQIRGTKTVLEVLSMAEGLADDAGDTVLIMRGAGFAGPGSLMNGLDSMTAAAASTPPIVEVFPRGYGVQTPESQTKGEIEKISLKKLLESGDPALNVPVHPGDIVKVPRAGIVYVVGEVRKPGGFVLQHNESISVLQALTLAEGPTRTSAMSHARIIRTDPATGKQTEILTDLAKIFSGKAPDTPLLSKDIVFVPNNSAKSVFYRTSEAALQTAAGVAIYKW